MRRPFTRAPARGAKPERGEVSVATVGSDIESVELADSELWADGPPYEVFKQMRSGCPIHWTDKIAEFPEEAGFWSVTTAEDVHAVSRDWETFSSELGGVTVFAEIFPLELARAMFIGMDPPKHDRVKALFQRGFTPKRIADHEDRIREIAVNVLSRLEGRETCDLVADVAQPVVSRVISSFMGLSEDEDAIWARIVNAALAPDDRDLAPDGIDGVLQKDFPVMF
jgi:cytochrome P450